MSDMHVSSLSAGPTGSSLTPLVERLKSHADVNRPSQTSREEFTGLLQALLSSGEGPRATAGPSPAADPAPVAQASAATTQPVATDRTAEGMARQAALRYAQTAAPAER